MTTANPLAPWNISEAERKKIFNDAKNSGKKIALYYAKGPNPATFRYRCYNTMQATLSSKKWQSVYFYLSELDTLKKLIPSSDIFILSRQSLWDDNIKTLITLAHKHHKKIIFDIDDLVFDEKYLETALNSIGDLTSLKSWATYFSGIKKTCQNVDKFFVTNDYLGEKISSDFNKPAISLPNGLNFEQIAAAETYLSLNSKKHDGFVIGYFSGSPTHANDLNIALPEILDFLDAHPDSKLFIVGVMNFSGKAISYLKQGKIITTGPVDFRKLERHISEVDANIVPLTDTEFANCKSELKFFEASIVETPTLASPTYAFAHSIKNGKTGFLCRQGEWYSALEYLYNHPKESQKIATSAKKYCLSHYYGKNYLSAIEEAYDELAK